MLRKNQGTSLFWRYRMPPEDPEIDEEEVIIRV
jgi:hypothetical protein